MKFWKIGGCALGLLVLAASAAPAQQYQPRQGYRQPQQQQYQNEPRTASRGYSYNTQQNRQYAQPGQAGNSDHKIALWLANCNKAEIKLGKYAARHGESHDVRDFGDQLAQDHERMLEELHRFAPEVSSGESASSGSNESSRNENSRNDESSTASSRGQEDQSRRDNRAPRQWNDATVSQQISERIARKARDELSEKEGSDFDRCFVGQQLVCHQQDLAKLEVLRQYASHDLREIIDEAVQTVEGHEQQARDLMKQLAHEDRSSSSSNRQSSRSRSSDSDRSSRSNDADRSSRSSSSDSDHSDRSRNERD